MVNIAVISQKKSDFSRALESIPDVSVTYILPEEAENCDFSDFDSFCILGGVAETPLVLSGTAWKRLERYMRAGKKFFVEYCRNLGEGDYGPPVTTINRRLVYLGEPLGLTQTFDLLDDQCNQMIIFNQCTEESQPFLVSDQFVRAHYRAPDSPEYWHTGEWWAYFQYSRTIHVCNFRISNFEKMRFAPVNKWREVIRHIMSWLTEIFAPQIKFNDIYNVLPPPRMRDLEPNVVRTVESALAWLENSGVLVDDARNGVYEGFNHIISYDGVQEMDQIIRCDTCGEVSTAFLFEYMRTGNSHMLTRFNRLQKYMYSEFLIKSGTCKGLLRKSNYFLSVSSQDHTCRAIMSTLLAAYHIGDNSNLENACMALDFLISITGTDGLIGEGVETITIDKDLINRRSNSVSNRQSPYFNGAYMSTLLLAHMITGKEKYRQVAERGMNTLMRLYPKNNIRLVSETSELCRLLLPTIYLYWVTKKTEHLEFFKKLTHDLNRFVHVSGAYLEWDTGYLAPRNNKASLLASNGDPVVDLSGSLNWVPMAFSEAYRITGDIKFYKLWQNMARFLVSCQLHSDDKKIDGCWPRGFDPDLMEVYGIFSDVGWRPWSIKSGWVLSEIVAGLQNGLLFKPDKNE